jgi:hypothetical protein
MVAVMAAAAIPSSIAGLDMARTKGAARHLGARVAFARMEAAKRGVYVALRFEGSGAAVSFAMFADGNRNGVRTRDIDRGIDRRIDSRVRLAEQFPGVSYGLSAAAGGGDPLRIGSSQLLSISPVGTATSGTLYVRGRDGTQLAVRITGTTGRTRILRFDERSRQWVDF